MQKMIKGETVETRWLYDSQGWLITLQMTYVYIKKTT